MGTNLCGRRVRSLKESGTSFMPGMEGEIVALTTSGASAMPWLTVALASGQLIGGIFLEHVELIEKLPDGFVGTIPLKKKS